MTHSYARIRMHVPSARTCTQALIPPHARAATRAAGLQSCIKYTTKKHWWRDCTVPTGAITAKVLDYVFGVGGVVGNRLRMRSVPWLMHVHVHTTCAAGTRSGSMCGCLYDIRSYSYMQFARVQKRLAPPAMMITRSPCFGHPMACDS